MKSTEFDHKKMKLDGVSFWILSGRMYRANMREWVTASQDFFESDCGKLVLELSALEFIDSFGIRALVILFKKANNKGIQMKIIGLRGQPKEVFSLLRLDEVFECEEHSQIFRELQVTQTSREFKGLLAVSGM